MMSSRTSALRAFTLVETIIVVALFTVMLFALFDFYINYNATYRHEEAVVKTASSAGAVVNEVSALAGVANRVIASRTIDGVTHTSGANTLVIELPALDASGVVIVGVYDYVAFYIEGTSAYRIIDADNASVRRSGTRLLSDSASALVFAYDNASFPDVTQVTVDIVTTLQVKETTVEQHLTQRVNLRNNVAL
ncbi:MAG TPA: hypothetical protein VFY28_01720 [Candidatus Paceibacterota bacterium]|nr:hypothetical protein [Candidatus Paceibacterota bacterium]